MHTEEYLKECIKHQRPPVKLFNITDEDAIAAAKIAKIGDNPTVFKTGTGRDKDSILISDDAQGRTVRIYFNGDNTVVYHKGIEVRCYCYQIMHYLKSIGYDWSL